MNIKLVVTDIDGVWTDGGMYYDNTGNELKKFHTYDSAGVLFLKQAKIEVAIITGEETAIVAKRAKKLGVQKVYQGIKDKWTMVNQLAMEMNISPNQIAYIGDDLNDWECLSKLEFTAVPNSAPDYIKDSAKWKLNKKGGDGVFREFVELILSEMGILNEVLSKFNPS